MIEVTKLALVLYCFDPIELLHVVAEPLDVFNARAFSYPVGFQATEQSVQLSFGRYQMRWV